MVFHLCYNKNEVLCLTMTKDYKNFSKVANLAVERVKLKNAESPKFCDTETINRYREKKMACTPLRRGCVLRTVFERRRRSTTETMLVDEIESTKEYREVTK